MEHKLKVGCRGIKKYVAIGVYEEEQKLKCLLEFNCEVEVDTSSAHYESAKTFNYTHIAEAIEKSSAKSFRLLEEMADEIIKQLQQHGNAIRTIDLEIIKKNPVIKHYQGDVFIRICR